MTIRDKATLKGYFNTGDMPTEANLADLIDSAKNFPRAPRIVTLIAGHDDETPLPVEALNTVEVDTTNYKVGDRGLKVNVLGNSGHQVNYDFATPLVLPATAALGLWVYVEDATKLTSLAVTIFFDAGYTVFSQYTAAMVGALVNGWNFLRWGSLAATTPPQFTHIYRIRFGGGSNAATSYTIGHLWAECPEKAQIIFIHDGGYSAFYSTGYPDLKVRQMPVTFAMIPNNVGTAGYMSQAQADELAGENGNSMSFHTWAGGDTSTMTAAQLRADTMQCLKWLKLHGYSGGLMRSAFLQNLAPQHAAIRPLVLAYPRVSATTVRLTCYPFEDRYDVPRLAIHAYNADANALVTFFDQLETYHALGVFYTHKIDPAGVNDTTPTRWAQFLSLVDTGLSEGWLEGVTFEQLVGRAGFEFRQGLGDWVTEYYDATGTLAKVRLP